MTLWMDFNEAISRMGPDWRGNICIVVMLFGAGLTVIGAQKAGLTLCLGGLAVGVVLGSIYHF